MPPLDPNLEKRLQAAEKACRAAGSIQREHYESPDLQISTKGTDIDLVTQVDHACDQRIRDILQQDLNQALGPQTFLTEETYQEGTAIDLTDSWVVDPLDGTNNYTHGFPFFAVSIAWVQQGKTRVAVVYDALRDECFTAIEGQGAWKNGFLTGTRMQVSRFPTLNRAIIATGFPYDTPQNPMENLQPLAKVMQACQGIRRAGAAALDLTYVACGRLDGFWEFHLSPWDVAAGELLVKEAGGTVCGFDGMPLNLSQRRIEIIAASQPAIEKLLVSVCSPSLV